MRIKKAHVAFAIYYLVGLGIVLTAEAVLPDKYFFDSAQIAEYVSYGDLWFGGGSFAGTAKLYSLLTAGKVLPQPAIGAANFTIALLLLVATYRAAGQHWSRRPFTLFSIWALLLAVFLGMYSKELFTYLLGGVVVWLIAHRSALRYTLTAGLFIAYGMAVREYWLLILALFASLVVILERRSAVAIKVGMVCVVLGVMLSAFKYGSGMFLTDVRTAMNSYSFRLNNPNIVTITHNLVANSSLGTDALNLLYAWAMFLIPIPMLRTAAPQHIAFALWQIINVILVGAIVVRFTRWHNYGIVEAAEWKRIQMSVAFLIAVTLILAGFDGDFGSYVRHQTAALPVLFYIMLRHEVAVSRIRSRAVMLDAWRRNESDIDQLTIAGANTQVGSCGVTTK